MKEGGVSGRKSINKDLASIEAENSRNELDKASPRQSLEVIMSNSKIEAVGVRSSLVPPLPLGKLTQTKKD
jgi:hypothetical protein